MYIVFRCDCGRVLSANEANKTRKCPCGKTVKISSRRILTRVEDSKDVPYVIQEFQDVLYKNTDFVSADKLKK